MNKQRLEGYRQALKDYGLTEYKELQILLDPSSANYEGSREAMNQLINQRFLLMVSLQQMTACLWSYGRIK